VFDPESPHGNASGIIEDVDREGTID